MPEFPYHTPETAPADARDLLKAAKLQSCKAAIRHSAESVREDGRGSGAPAGRTCNPPIFSRNFAKLSFFRIFSAPMPGRLPE